MDRPTDITSLQRDLLATGTAVLGDLGPWPQRADARGTVSARSRLLCAALSQLALETHRALGGRSRTAEVKRAAAMLSLLTKINDQVIDGWDLHGGAETSRAVVRSRVEQYLAPTLASIHAASPMSDEPRCALAAELGTLLRSIAGAPACLEQLLDLIDRGWAIQVDAVEVFTANPSTVTAAAVDTTTAGVSGAWLLMVAMVGTLPADSARAMTAAEQRAFFDWGLHIQRADALADLHGDLAEGLIGTSVGHALHTVATEGQRAALADRDADAVYAAVATHRVDRALLPDPGELRRLDGVLAGLGRLPSLLRWIHGMLLFRYLVHPSSRRAPDDTAFEPFIGETRTWIEYLTEVARVAGETVPPRGPDPGAVD